MGYFDVVTGYQSWSDYISSQQQIRGFDQALQRQTKSLQVSLGNPKDRQRALEKGLGAIEGAISGGMGQVADNLEFGFDRLGSGIESTQC